MSMRGYKSIKPSGDLKVYDTPQMRDIRGKASGDHRVVNLGKRPLCSEYAGNIVP